MRKRSGQVHSRESSATLQLTVSLLYPARGFYWTERSDFVIMTIDLPYRDKICLKMYKNISVEQKSTWRGSSVKKKETLRQTGVSGDHTDHAIWYQYVGTDLPDVRSRHLAG